MNAGLPGTGLGGLFYLVLALYMPLHELVRTLRGRGSTERWRLALSQAAVAVGIVAAMVAVLVAAVHLLPGDDGISFALLGPLTAGGVLVALVCVIGVWSRWSAFRGAARTSHDS